MVGLYDLSPGPPKSIGLTRQNPYPSLHGRHSQQPERFRSPSLPIDAPPRGSSSDEEFDKQGIPDDGASDIAEFGRSQKKEKSDGNEILGTGTDSTLARGEDGKKRELSVEASNIRAGRFTSSKGIRSPNGSLSSHKRKDADLDDDDIPLSFSQQKKPRQGCGYGSTNIHRGSVTKPGNPKEIPPNESKKAGPAFRKPDTGAMLAQGRRPLRIGHSK